MTTLELCYETSRGAGVVRCLRDAVAVEKALKNLAKRQIEADLYIAGEQNEDGNRAERVGGVDHLDGENGRRTLHWQWWYDSTVFVVPPLAVSHV